MTNESNMYKSNGTYGIKAYCPPPTFEHAKRTLVGAITAKNEDGNDVTIYETRMPARFFSIDVGGEYTIHTGSGDVELLKLVFTMADMLTNGMLDIEKK